MSDDRSYIEPTPALRNGEGAVADAETALFLELAGQLSARGVTALAVILRRTAEICHDEGEAVALAVLDQIEAILNEEPPNA